MAKGASAKKIDRSRYLIIEYEHEHEHEYENENSLNTLLTVHVADRVDRVSNVS
ncbi:MAG: hypothetical protein ACR2NP_17740 [Pirellulaceae bacterium]